MSQESAPVQQDGIGYPDQLERLWTPYRMSYIRGESRPTDPSESQCPFCRIPKMDDVEGLIVHRGVHAFVVLNLFPYSPGHMMICPYRHIPGYVDTDDAEAIEIGQLTKKAIRVIGKVSGAPGFNIGMNQGEAGGAGIAAHLHQHIVPRWIGDQNFMPIIGGTKTLPELLGDTRALMAEAWATVD